MRKILMLSIFTLGLLSAATAAQARDYWSVSINAPIIVAPERTLRYVEYYEPAPRIVYHAVPVIYAGPIYYGHERNFREREHDERKHHREHHNHGRHYRY